MLGPEAVWGNPIDIEYVESDTPEDIARKASGAVARQMGFRIRSSGNVLGTVACDRLDIDGRTISTGPANDRELQLWRFAVSQVIGHYTSSVQLEAMKDTGLKYSTALSNAEARIAKLENRNSEAE